MYLKKEKEKKILPDLHFYGSQNILHDTPFLLPADLQIPPPLL